mmetsp:Transcript_27876/g.54212  ORF Transcript_27876/g.54212 Transcript_27876/m.54212 type:complete len:635 (-) Transcript_27876:100-2004(-)
MPLPPGTQMFDVKAGGVALDSVGLKEEVADAVRLAGITELFAVQAAVVPLALKCRWDHDLCVSAPTGSGKTLAYTLPILHALSGRAVKRLRALVVVPTRDLALQVFHVFQRFVNVLGLTAATCIGQRSFYAEQTSLVPEANSLLSQLDTVSMMRKRGTGRRGRKRGGGRQAGGYAGRGGAAAGRSGVDILIATPGRLMDHLDGTSGFTLKHLNFLVVDEADRLLGQNYQGWVQRVLSSAYPSMKSQSNVAEIEEDTKNGTSRNSVYAEVMQTMLFSATLNRDPMKQAQLRLRNPLFLTATEELGLQEYRTPEGLQERLVICSKNEKALNLLHLLLHLRATTNSEDGEDEDEEAEKEKPCRQIIVFASTKDAAHRLTRLIEASGLIEPPPVEFSSALPQGRRNAVVRQVKKGQIQTLVCSDAMSRGMDVMDVDAVINYDAPTHIRTYIHRVGRTARAGREGKAYTLLEPKQVRPFKGILRHAQNGYVARHIVDKEKHLDPLVPRFQRSLHRLKNILEREQNGGLDPTRPARAADLLSSEDDDDEDEDEAEEEKSQGKDSGMEVEPEKDDDDDDDEDDDDDDDDDEDEDEEEGSKDEDEDLQRKEKQSGVRVAYKRWTHVPSIGEAIAILADCSDK